MICDVLAGEQGPSCASLDQIPDLKVVQVCFIEPNNRDGDENIVTLSWVRLTHKHEEHFKSCVLITVFEQHLQNNPSALLTSSHGLPKYGATIFGHYVTQRSVILPPS